MNILPLGPDSSAHGQARQVMLGSMKVLYETVKYLYELCLLTKQLG